jgi:hypothetical protein
VPATVEEGIFSLLNNAASVQAVLAPDGGGTNCRLYPGTIAEEAALPAAAFARVGGRRQLTVGGPEALIRARFQFTTAAQTYDECVTAMEALIGILHGYSGAFPNGIVVQQISMLGDLIDEFDIGSRMYARHCDFEVIYNDPAR